MKAGQTTRTDATLPILLRAFKLPAFVRGKMIPELKGQRYALLKNPENMTDAQLDFASAFLARSSTIKTARAFHLRLTFQDFYAQPARSAERFLRRWCSWASRSRVPAMVRVSRTIREHWSGVLRWFVSKVTNGLIEGINSLIQTAKTRARVSGVN